MGNPIDAKIAELQAHWPRWEFGSSRGQSAAPSGAQGAADHRKRVVNAASAEHLAEYLEDAPDAE